LTDLNISPFLLPVLAVRRDAVRHRYFDVCAPIRVGHNEARTIYIHNPIQAVPIYRYPGVYRIFTYNNNMYDANVIELWRAKVQYFYNNNISQHGLPDASREKSQTYISCWFWPDPRCSLFGSACSRTVNHVRRIINMVNNTLVFKPSDTTVAIGRQPPSER